MEIEVTGTSYYDSPAWWQHFVDYIENKHSHFKDLPDNLQDRLLNNEMCKFHGRIIFREISEDQTDVKSIVFQDEKHATFFVLKWS